jgi:predicted permease
MKWRRQKHKELDEEIRAHLEMVKRDRMARGESAEVAEAAARRELGNRTLVKEITREVWRWNSLERLGQDLRYALRMMRRGPGFTAIAVLSLALGIGANTAIFSLIDTVMLRLLPVEQPERLVELLAKYPGQGRDNAFSWQGYEYMRDHTQVLSGLIADCPNYAHFHVRVEGSAWENVDGDLVSGNFFSTLGIKPVMGRMIVPKDDRMGASRDVAVVSWSYWNSRFHGDPAVVGKRILVEDRTLTVIGVAPRAFFGLQTGTKQDVWLPLGIEPTIRRGNSYTRSPAYMWLNLVGRLKPGKSIEQARTEMRVLYRTTIEDETKTNDDPSRPKWTIEVEPAGMGLSRLRDLFKKPLLFLMSVVGLLLLIACTNVASMLLARGAAREREMALRVSLGAGRFRLVRQMLTESLLLSAMGSALGVVLAYFGTAALVKLIANGQMRIELNVRPDAEVLLFATGIALLTGVLFGFAPALRAQHAAPISSLRTAGKSGETRFPRLFGKSLVAIQVALSVVLLSGASLFIRHLSDLEHIDLGFHRDHLVLMELDTFASGYKGEKLSRAYQELLKRLESIPGVRSAAICAASPIQGIGANRAATVEGYRDRPGERRLLWENWVGPRYFVSLGTPLLAGRDFTFDDRGRARVAIVNQTMARHYFGDGSPVGRHVTFDGDKQPYEIVGMVGDAKYSDIRGRLLPTIYLHSFQDGPQSQFAIRTSVNPSAVVGELRRAVRETLKTIEVKRLTTMEDQVDASIVPERLIAILSGLFGGLGSLLAAVGLYGLLAYTVARRVNEIGVRMALGATRWDVIRMVLRDGLGMVCTGLAVGVPMVFWSRRFAAGLIEGLTVNTSVPIVFGALAMLAIALVAAYVPARRAAGVDPMEALRHE